MQSPLEPPRRFRPPVAQTLAHAGNGLANELHRLSLLEHQAADVQSDTAPPSERAGTTPVSPSVGVPLIASEPVVPQHAPKTPTMRKWARRAPANAGADSDSDSDGGRSDMPSLKTVDCSSCSGDDDSDGEALWSSDAEGDDK